MSGNCCFTVIKYAIDEGQVICTSVIGAAAPGDSNFIIVLSEIGNVIINVHIKPIRVDCMKILESHYYSSLPSKSRPYSLTLSQ